MIVQDDIRERKLIEIFNLRAGEGNRIGVDAFDTFGNPFELKTTSKNSVSTARDLGLDHIEKWSKRYWLVANFVPGAADFKHFYFLAPRHMQIWYDRIRLRLKRDHDLSRQALENTIMPPDAKKRLAYLLHRGALLNDPNISWKYIEQHGICIKDNYANRLEALVSQYPLDIAQNDDPFQELICFA